MMPRIVIIIILAVIVLGGIIFLLNKTPKKNWPTYENSRYHFQVPYPADWQLGSEEENNTGREFISPDQKITCYAYGFANALTSKSDNPQTLDEFIDWLLEDENTTLIEKKSTDLGKDKAVEIVTKEEGNKIKQAVYSLNNTDGRGFYCLFPDLSSKQNFQDDFQFMVNSFQNVVANEKQPGEAKILACAALLENNVAPLKDLQTFVDDKYTEVAITSRESWDKNKLPAKVLELQNKNYQCYPMPFEQEEGKQTAGMNIEPVIKSVQWICELKYADYKYLALNKISEKDKLSGNNYQCVKETCTDDGIKNSSVWLCTK